MIILYKKDEKNFISNGEIVLDNAIQYSKVTEDSTCTDYLDRYYLELELDVDSEEANKIEKDMIIKSPIPNNQEDYFVISKIRKDLDILYVKAIQIFYTMEDNFVEDTNIVDKTGYAALDQMQSNTQYPHKFNFHSDISVVNTARMVRKNFVSALIGDEDNTFVSRWGGELQTNKFDVYMNTTRGADRGVTIEYKKNLTGLDAIINYDDEEYYTRVMPEGYDGLFLDEKYVDSPLIDSDRPKIRVVKFDDIKVKEREDDEEGYASEEDAKNALREAAEKLFSVEHHDIPPSSYEINFVELTDTEEYKDYSCLERIWMGDTVTVKHREIGLDIKARLVKYEFDPLDKCYISLQLGDAVSGITSKYKDLSKKIDNDIKTVKTDFQQVYDDAVSELTDMITSGIKGHTYTTENEYMVMDTTDPLTAVNVARFNVNGLGFSVNGINGPYLGLTREGKLVITEATAYKFTAALVETGILQSIDGKCWINLDNSTFNFDNYMSLLEDENGNRTFKIKLSDGTDLEEKLNTVVTQSEITSTADEIKLSVGETGAYNMVKNSRAEQNTNFWHGTVARYGNSSSAKLTNGTYFRVDNDTTSEKFMYSDIFAIKPNTTYTLVLTVMRSAYCTGIDIHFLGFKDKSNVDTHKTSFDYVHTVAANKVYAEGVWTKEVITFTTKSDELCGYIRLDNNGSSQAGTLCKAYFTDILMYEGAIKNSDGDIIAKPWSPYPAELYSADMIIDKKGVLQRNNGVNSIGLSENALNVYDFEGDDHIAGKYRAYRTTNKINNSSRCGVALHSRYDDLLILGYLNSLGQLNEVMVFDSTKQHNGSTVGLFGDITIFDILTFKGTDNSYGGDILSDSSMLRIRANFDAGGKVVIGQSGSLTDNVMEVTRSGLYHVGNIGAGGNMSCKNMTIVGNLDVTGVIIGNINDTSDIAYKKNIKPLEKDTLQIVKDINIYEYEENGTTEIGLLAQEAVKVIPDIIKGEVTNTTIEEANTMTEEERSEKLKGGKGASVDVYSMLSLLWDANKKLLDKVEELENKLKGL